MSKPDQKSRWIPLDELDGTNNRYSPITSNLRLPQQFESRLELDTARAALLMRLGGISELNIISDARPQQSTDNISRHSITPSKIGYHYQGTWSSANIFLNTPKIHDLLAEKPENYLSNLISTSIKSSIIASGRDHLIFARDTREYIWSLLLYSTSLMGTRSYYLEEIAYQDSLPPALALVAIGINYILQLQVIDMTLLGINSMEDWRNRKVQEQHTTSRRELQTRLSLTPLLELDRVAALYLIGNLTTLIRQKNK